MKFFKKIINGITVFSKNCVFNELSYINRFSVYKNTTIGKYSYIGPFARITNCEIGSFCSVASKVCIGLPTHPTDWLSSSPLFFNPSNGIGINWVEESFFDDSVKKTIIGNDVWIGDNVTILGGVKIGDGAILAAGCVVTKDVESYSIVGGVPAHTIRKRFNEDVIKELNIMSWWSFDESFLKDNISFFQNPIDIESVFQFKNLYKDYENKR